MPCNRYSSVIMVTSSIANVSRSSIDINMGNGMNKILPGLYIGNFSDSKDKGQLTENNITHIVSAHDNAKALLKGYKYHCIRAADSVGQDLTPYFAECILFIHKARVKGGNVLVHCIAGISRSTTLATAYIMTVTDMDWMEILKCIKCSRSVANPNSGFQRQLYEFGCSEERKTLKEKLNKKYPTNPFNDEEVLKELIANASENQARLSEEYKDGIDTVAKYTNTSNRNVQVYHASSEETKDDPPNIDS